jgi:hypothetical protein
MIVRSEKRPQQPESGDGPAAEIEEFVRYCYRRRRVSWPEIYDDMCAVAARGEFRGWRLGELAERGVTFTIAELPRLAALVERIVEQERAVGPHTEVSARP